MIENDKHPKKWVRQTDPCPIVIYEDKKPPFGRKKVAVLPLVGYSGVSAFSFKGIVFSI